MKNAFIISLFILVAVGCKKNPLDLVPDGRMTISDVFKKNTQTAAYLNSCYGYMQPHGMLYYYFAFLADFTDDSHNNDDPTENLAATAWYHGALSPSDNPLNTSDTRHNRNFYEFAWNGIYKTNEFLAHIDNATVTNPDDRARWKAEAKILRAYYYWELIKMYGGMPIVDKPFPADYNYSSLKRNSFDSCVQFIMKNCEAAIAEPAMPWRITTGERDRGRMTKAVAYAIESEATLFNASPLWNPDNDLAKWQQAAKVSKRALDALTSHGYALAPDYEAYFITTPDLGSDPKDKETILEIKDHTAIDHVQFLGGIPSLQQYRAGSSPSQELVDAYDMKNGQPAILGYLDVDHLHPIINAASGYNDNDPYNNRDPRFYATVFYNESYYGKINGVPHYVESYVGGTDGIRNNNRKYTHNGYYLHKYVDNSLSVSATSGARWKQFRLAEIYLNLAEAENEANNAPTPTAYAAVNAIRERVDMPDLPTGLNKEAFRVRVRDERRVEMPFEDKRFWDVRRWKILDKTGKLTTGMQWTKHPDGHFSVKRIVVDRRHSWSDKFLIFPIPLKEISNLPSFVQNPGW